MRILNKTILSGMLLLQMFAICTQASSLKVNHLKCEELVNPLAIDNTTAGKESNRLLIKS